MRNRKQIVTTKYCEKYLYSVAIRRTGEKDENNQWSHFWIVERKEDEPERIFPANRVLLPTFFVQNQTTDFVRFSQRTGIAESSISDWKKKRTNPVSDKILIICEVLDVTPYELLSGAEHTGNRSRDNDTYVISKGTEIGNLVESYQRLSSDMQKRLVGYLEALNQMN